MIISVILSLVVGLAGGYAAFRFVQPDGIESFAATDTERTSELEAKIAQQARELDALTEKLAAANSEVPRPEDLSPVIDALHDERTALVAENKTLKENLAKAEAERDAVRQDASASDANIANELARLQNEVVPELTAERDRLNRKTLMMLADQTNLKVQAKSAAETKAKDAQRISELEARLADAERKLASSQAALEELTAEKLKAPVAGTLALSTDDLPSEPAAAPGAQEAVRLEPRAPEAVAAALRAAPGLETLSDDARQELTNSLVSGECVTTVLEAVFERVPILTLRNLIRDLNSDC